MYIEKMCEAKEDEQLCKQDIRCYWYQSDGCLVNELEGKIDVFGTAFDASNRDPGTQAILETHYKCSKSYENEFECLKDEICEWGNGPVSTPEEECTANYDKFYTDSCKSSPTYVKSGVTSAHRALLALLVSMIGSLLVTM